MTDQLAERAHRVHRAIVVLVGRDHVGSFRHPLVNFVETIAQISRKSGVFSGVDWARLDAAGNSRQQRTRRILSFIWVSFGGAS